MHTLSHIIYVSKTSGPEIPQDILPGNLSTYLHNFIGHYIKYFSHDFPSSHIKNFPTMKGIIVPEVHAPPV